MKRVKKENISKEEINKDASKKFEKVGGKQVIGLCRITHVNGKVENHYTDEDGKNFIEDDNGKTINKKQKYETREARLKKLAKQNREPK